MRQLGRLLMLFRPYWGWALFGIALALATLLANVMLMAVSGWFITAMAAAGAAGATMNYFTPAAIIRACAIVRTSGRYGERLVTHEATFRLIARLRVWLFTKVEPQPPGALQRFHSGDLANRLRADIDTLETAYLRLFAPLVVAIVGAGAVVVWMGFYSRAIALTEGVLIAVTGFLVPIGLARLSARRGRRQVQLAAALAEAAVDGVQGMSELQVFGAAQFHAARFADMSRAFIGEKMALGKLASLSQAVATVGGNLALWGVVVLAIPLVRHGNLAPPELVMLALAAMAAFEAVLPLPAALLGLAGVQEAARRVFALADVSPPPPAHREDTVRLVRCDIRVRNLSYRYAGAGVPTLHGFDLDLPQGRRIAVVGPVGAGKSTLVMLLTGLIQADSGNIAINGRDIADYDGETVRRCFAVAPQQPGLFSGTVRDILRLGKPDAEDAALWRALTLVGLDDFVVHLPEGLDTWLGEAGLTVSGGQARRLSIARALLRDAQVLILDEPGEGLDTHSERTLLADIVANLDGRSLVLITHRKAGLELVAEVVHIG
ncbi:MAG: thiol reductant ABC exporter subunit CydC [Pseudolabrys sp.]|jgi:ATP-binding cassette, subfamily C, bacterial CydC